MPGMSEHPRVAAWKAFVAWWKSLGLETKIGLISFVFVILTFIAAALVVPEVRIFLSLEKPKEEQPQTQPTPPTQGGGSHPGTEAPPQPQPEEPEIPKPKIKYVPLPSAAPLRSPKTLVTAIPQGQDQQKTVDIGGEKVPVMTQAEADRFLTHKVDLESYGWTYTKPVDVWVTVGKDGSVLEVHAANGNAKIKGNVESAIRQWKFTPFLNERGEEVSVQTIIQLDGKNTPDVQKP